MSRKIILIKQELLVLVYELNRSGLLAENEKIRPILFFFKDTAPTEIYTLSLHDALPISAPHAVPGASELLAARELVRRLLPALGDVGRVVLGHIPPPVADRVGVRGQRRRLG